jgi:hypothetical protein
MNKYLLLRDNKQSGPYTVDDLAKHGLKPYDLVWLEGKSAAWRYPSELEELKPFAPVVEEQPFDRFYKKADTPTSIPIAKDHTSVKQTPAFMKEEVKSLPPEKPSEKIDQPTINQPKKIHVSLPVTNPAIEAEKIAVKVEEQTYLKPSKPTDENSKPQVQTVPVADSKIISNETKKTSHTKADFEKRYRDGKKKEVENDTVSKNPATVSKLLFRSVAAACLLLGGALIGLIINYNNQQKKFQQLNQLVEEIRQQDNVLSSIPVNNKLNSNTPINSNPVGEVNQQIPPVEEKVYKENIQLPLPNKEKKKKKTNETISPIIIPDTQITRAEIEPLVSQEEEAEKARRNTELAKKNLWQLVSVDHNKYKTGVFGGISNLQLKLSNKSLYQLEQVEVEVKYIGPEKKLVNKQTVIFENVSPGEQLSVPVPKSNRGVDIEYVIKKINTKELGIASAGM